MNATELIAEVLEVVDSEGFSDDDALKYLNRAQLAIANRLLLPELADGYDTVTTVVDGFSVALPSDYHKGLFLAQVDDKKVQVFKDLMSLSTTFESVTVTAGDVAAVATNAGNLIYQRVPEETIDIELFYYRKPVKMTDVATSFPDGLTDVDAYDDAILYFTNWKMQNSIESGVEGVKIDTEYNKRGFDEMLDILSLHCVREGVAIAETPANKTW